MLVLCSPIYILLCMFAFTSTDFHKGHQSFVETLHDHPRQSETREEPRVSTQMFITSTHSPDIHVRLQQRVDAVDYPAEQASVQRLGHGVSDVNGFVHGVGANDGLAPGDHTLGGQRLLELLRADAEERRS